MGGRKANVTVSEGAKAEMGARSKIELEMYAGVRTHRARPRAFIPTAVGKPLKHVSSRVTGWVFV